MSQEPLTLAEAGFAHGMARIGTVDDHCWTIDAGAAADLSASLACTEGESPLQPRDEVAQQWLNKGTQEPLGVDLVVVGATLVGRLESSMTRRRLAALFQQLPPCIARRVRANLEEMGPLKPIVDHRVNEVYGRIAAGAHSADEELAMVGLFFVVSAWIFRHNPMLSHLESALSAELSRRCRKYRRACLRSHKPELTYPISQTLRPILKALVTHDLSEPKESHHE